MAEKNMNHPGCIETDIIENANDLIVVLDPQGKVLVWNRAAESITGYSRNDVIGSRDVWKRLYPDADYRRRITHRITDIITKNQYFENLETTIVTKAGEQRVISWNTRQIEYGGDYRAIAIGRDITGIAKAKRDEQITERKKAEEALRWASAYHRNLIEASLDPLVTIDPDGKISDVNAATEKITGYSRDNLVGSDFSYYFTEPKKAREGYEKVFKEGIVRDYELEIRHKDGLLTPVLYNASVYRDESGNVTGVFAAARDITDRRRAEEALKEILKESEARYNALFFNTHSVSLLIDPDTGMITDVNSAACKYYGYSREQLITMRIFDLNRLPADKVLRDLSAAKKEREKHFTSVHYLANGECRNVEVYSGPITVKGKTLFYSIIHDITDRKRAEEALRESETKLNVILQSSPIPKFVIDTGHRVISWNKALEETSGIKAKDVIGTNQQWRAFYDTERPCMADLLVDGAVDKIPELYKDKVKKSEVVEGAYEATDFFPHIDRTGKWLHFIAAPIIDADGKVIGAIETLEDITPLVRAQQELKESEEQYSALFYNNYSVSLLIDPDTGIIVDANNAAVRYYGYSREQLTSMGIYDLNRLPKDSVVRDLQRAKDKKEKHFLSTHYLAGGEKRNVEVYSGPIRVKGKPLFYSIIHDITDRKQAEADLKKYSDKLEEMVSERTKNLREAQDKLVKTEKLAVLGKLAGGVGHELRNPLGAIKNAAYFLNMVLENPDPDVKDTIEIINKEVARSECIISSLLDFARPTILTLRKVAVNKVISETVTRNPIPANITVTSNLDETIPEIMADPDKLLQVFTNLITNAVQAMPDSGKLTLTSYLSDTGHVVVSVRDTGVGIPEENMKKLFEPLFTTKAKGIGLGLVVIKAIVKAHHGSIDVQSEVGKGTTFTVKLPIGIEEGH
ncbi:MAG: PAS domain S-box protein [Methanoregula sp.]|nr:PAS domain S-box protein [Methanoregula sp.]